MIYGPTRTICIDAGMWAMMITCSYNPEKWVVLRRLNQSIMVQYNIQYSFIIVCEMACYLLIIELLCC